MRLFKKAEKDSARSGLQRRWQRNILSLVAVVVLLASTAFGAATAVYSYNAMRSGLQSKAKSAAAFLQNYLDLSYEECYESCVLLTQDFEDKNTLELQFLNGNGELVASSYGLYNVGDPPTADVTQALSTRQMTYFLGKDPTTSERILSVCSPMVYTGGRVVGVLRFVSSMKNADRFVLISLLAAGVFALVVLIAVYFSSNRYLKSILIPVSEITETAKRIAGGSYGVQIQKKFDDEIGELADTVNDMSKKIAQSERTQSEFMSSVSHELRTPLTAITGWGETLLASENASEETRRGIGIILRETRRLTSMVEELLEFTRMQDGRFTLNVRVCDLRADFEDTVFMYGSRLRQEGITLDYLDSDDEIPELPCDPERMRQVFLNILDNAAKHGGEGKRITASIAREGAWVVVRIRDYGPGIPEEELPHVKKKFYKGSSKARGSGIGLAVCEEIVAMHGGTLELTNAVGGGTLVTVSLPIPEV